MLMSNNTRGENNSDYIYCTVCHGSGGNGNQIIGAPKISGMEPWYLKRQLQAFKAKFRGTHKEDVAGLEMRAVALMLKDSADIDSVMAYVAKLESKIPPSTIEADIQHGQLLYTACQSCHGTKAEGNEQLRAPSLVYQNDWYLVKQIEDMRAGMRGNHKDDIWGRQMRLATMTLSNEQDINDVVAYIMSLR